MSEETIGTRIAKLRNEYSYSQEYVAEKLGVSRQAVSKWEQNQSSPDTENLIALSQLFNVTVEYLAIGKIQEQKAEKPQIKSTQKIIGYILLGAGLLSLILGIILEVLLIIASVYFIVIGIECLTVRKYFILTLLYTLVFISGILAIFSTSFVSFNVGIIVLCSCTALLVVLIVVTLCKKRKKEKQIKKEKSSKTKNSAE